MCSWRRRECPNGGTGRRTRLKIVRETMWVRVPLWAPKIKSTDRVCAFYFQFWGVGLEKEWSSCGEVKADPERRQKMSGGHFLRRGLPSPTLGTKNNRHRFFCVCYFFVLKSGARKRVVKLLSALLKSNVAVSVSVNIMKAFIEMRKFLMINGQVFERLTSVEHKLLEHDKKIDIQKFNK